MEYLSALKEQAFISCDNIDVIKDHYAKRKEAPDHKHK